MFLVKIHIDILINVKVEFLIYSFTTFCPLIVLFFF